MANQYLTVESGNQTDGDSDKPLVTGIPSPPKNKGGRPPGSKTKNRTAPLSINVGAKTESVPARLPDVDKVNSAKFIGDAAVSVLELGESIILGACERKIQKRFPSKLTEYRELSTKLALQEKDKEVISSTTQIIAMKSDWLIRNAPAVVLGAFLSQYALRMLSLTRFVNSVTAPAAQSGGREGEVSEKINAP